MEQEAMNNQNTDAGKNAPLDVSELALFLAKTYGQMLKDRDRFKAVIDAGVTVYTKEMAIRDLSSISIDYESDRVQTSNISNIPERIAELLDNGYVEKMNRRLQWEMEETVKEYDYLVWKIEVVETALAERMDGKERAVFERLFAKGKSYRQVCKAYKKGTLHNNQLFILRNRCLQTVADHLKNISVFPVCSKHMSMLEREYRDNHKRESEGEEDNG